jgi:hypothetical protein
MELASPFSGFNGHAARLSLPRASATSWPILSAKCHEVLLAKVLLKARGFATISSFLAGNRPIVRGASHPASEGHGSNTRLARGTPWLFVGSGGRDVALVRDKVSHVAWPLNLERGDASFMAAARLDLGRRRGVRG